MLLYRDEIIYANEYLKKIFNIADNSKYKLLDFIKNNHQEIQNYINKRKAGEDVFSYRERIEFISTDNKKYYLNSYANTILYNGEYVGFALITDETKEVKKEKFLEIINKISEKLLSISSKKDFLNVVYLNAPPEVLNHNVFLPFIMKHKKGASVAKVYNCNTFPSSKKLIKLLIAFS